MKKIKVGLIGLGSQIIKEHVPAILGRGDIEIKLVFDQDDSAIKNFFFSFPELTTKKANNLMDFTRNVVDFVIVAVPHSEYPLILKTLARLKMPVMKEKPIATSINEAVEIFSDDWLNENCLICTQRRFSPTFVKVPKYMKKLGKIYLFNFIYKLSIDDPTSGWRGNFKKSGGGCLVDMGYHVIDLINWWFGKPKWVFGRTSSIAMATKTGEVEDTVIFQLETNSETLGNIVISRKAGKKEEKFQIYGQKGYIEVTKSEFIYFDYLSGKSERFLSNNKAEGFDKQLNFFISSLKKNKGFSENIFENLENMKIIEAIYQSANNNKLNYLN